MWSHKKHKSVGGYRGNYFFLFPDRKKERVFVLTGLKKNGDVHTIAFESVQAAKKQGWVKE